MRRGACLVVLAVLASGCGTVRNYLGGTDNSDPPAKLVTFRQSMTVQTLWSTRVGKGSGEQYVKLAPIVVGGKVFAADSKGHVGAYDAATGRPVWEIDTETPISGGPGSGDGLVLVGTRNAEVLALDEEKGKLLWRSFVSSEVLSPPRAGNGVVVARTIDGKLFGLDEKKGDRIWTYDSAVPALTLRGTSAPLIVEDKVVAGFADGKLAAITLNEGKLLWQASIAEPRGRTELERLVDISGEPTLADGILYVASFQGHVAAVEINSGQVLWEHDVSSHAGLEVDTRRVYVSNDQSDVLALARRDGEALWKQGNLHARAITAPVVYGDYVVVGDYQGYLHWLSRDDGRFMARVRVDSDGIIATPTVANDTLYVSGKSGVLTALRAK